MGNDYEKNQANHSDDFKIENNFCIGQEEEDFEEAFKQIFKKKEANKEEHEECHEMKHKIYFLPNKGSFIQKEETQHICQENFIFKSKLDPNFKVDVIDINNEKNSLKINDQKNLICEDTKKTQDNCENNIYNNLGEGEGEINIVEEKKFETNNLFTEIDKQNKFRVYTLNEFNIFHPGGNVEFFRQIKEEINEDILSEQVNENKLSSHFSKFKIYKEKNKRTRKKAKEKRKRKEKPDDIRKKIKSRFLKTTKNRINQMLKSAKSKEFFDFLPQCFICNISKQKNKSIINMKFKELMSYKFYEEENKTDNNNKTMLQKKRSPDQKKYDNNVKVLKYLEKNYDICKKSNFNVIGNMTFREIFNEYLKSDEFEKEVEKLKTEQNNDKYIKDYMIKAYSFINYFSSCT